MKLERLRLSGDEPCAIETCYFSADEFAGLKQARLDRVSLFSILEHQYGIQIGHADEEVDATTADAQTARLLEIPANAAVLRIRQKIYFTTGRPGCTCSDSIDQIATLFLFADSDSKVLRRRGEIKPEAHRASKCTRPAIVSSGMTNSVNPSCITGARDSQHPCRGDSNPMDLNDPFTRTCNRTGSPE